MGESRKKNRKEEHRGKRAKHKIVDLRAKGTVSSFKIGSKDIPRDNGVRK